MYKQSIPYKKNQKVPLWIVIFHSFFHGGCEKNKTQSKRIIMRPFAVSSHPSNNNQHFPFDIINLMFFRESFACCSENIFIPPPPPWWCLVPSSQRLRQICFVRPETWWKRRRHHCHWWAPPTMRKHRRIRCFRQAEAERWPRLVRRLAFHNSSKTNNIKWRQRHPERGKQAKNGEADGKGENSKIKRFL